MVIEYTSAEINAAVIQFLAGVKEARLFAFHGEMGAGKTTFINAICSALKVKDAVCSPTFSIINEYKTSLGEKVFHIDLYRLKNEKEAIEAGVEDCIFSGNYCFVEWPEMAAGLFPEGTIHCYLSVIGENQRKLKIIL